MSYLKDNPDALETIEKQLNEIISPTPEKKGGNGSASKKDKKEEENV